MRGEREEREQREQRLSRTKKVEVRQETPKSARRPTAALANPPSSPVAIVLIALSRSIWTSSLSSTVDYRRTPYLAIGPLVPRLRALPRK